MPNFLAPENNCVRRMKKVWKTVVSVGAGPLRAMHFKYETIVLCHPERSEGSPPDKRSFASLRMTLWHWLRLTRTTCSLKCIGACGHPRSPTVMPIFSRQHSLGAEIA